jgi:hypothetical protein
MEQDKTYIIRFDINGKELVFRATIISQNETFVTFKDKFNKELTYNKKFIVSIEEVGE